MSDDRTRATALAIAERKLISIGRKFGAEDIGWYAAEIIKALDEALPQ
jgi:hypothetical protein